jgi:hypothetical protein
LPLAIVPPRVSDTAPVTVMMNLSTPPPGSPLSCTQTLKVQFDVLFSVQVPEKVALLPETHTLVIETLCTFNPREWFSYSSCPLSPLLARCALKPKLAKPGEPGTAISPPPVTLPVLLQTSPLQIGVGVAVGVIVGVFVGVLLGVLVGVFEGVTVGVLLGVTVGVIVGVLLGVLLGVTVGVLDGVVVGVSVGVIVGVFVGVLVNVGVSVGVFVGVWLGV